MKTYYQILGVTDSATMQDIKVAFRKKAKECHPDTHPGDKAAEERFKDINEAYLTLSDEQKREDYNNRLQTGPQKKKATTPRSGAPDFGNMNFGDMFGSIFDDLHEKEKTQDTSTPQPTHNEKKRDDPLNVDDIFNKFMGFKP